MNIDKLDTSKIEHMLRIVEQCSDADFEQFFTTDRVYFTEIVYHEYDYLVNMRLCTPSNIINKNSKVANLTNEFLEFLKEYRKLTRL